MQGDDDIECLSSGSWSSWPPTCVEIDCGRPDDVDNGRVFQVNGSTVIGSTLEYHCFPGYERSGKQFNRHFEFRVQMRVQIKDKFGDDFSTRALRRRTHPSRNSKHD